MTDEALIDELARALCKHDNRDPDYQWEEYSRCLDADGRPETYTLIAWREYEPQAWAILPIIRRREIEAGEKVKEVAAATAKIQVVKRERELEVCGSNRSRTKMKCRVNESSILLGDIRALDVAAIIGGKHD